ncbi:MAG: preprotein translocase subunit SecG [Candidatus Liptonbacteria bacterium]|nr:preprotein translocase subunit SecG [Candidatus Liptonbacteria bacterium]
MKIISLIQVLISLAIIGLILLQERSGGMSGLMGGGEGSVYQTRRGLEKGAFYATIVLCVLFVGLAVYQLLR